MGLTYVLGPNDDGYWVAEDDAAYLASIGLCEEYHTYYRLTGTWAEVDAALTKYNAKEAS